MTAPATSLAPPPSAPRILIVDDDEAIRHMTRRILESHHYNVLTFCDGAAALEATRVGMMQPGGTIDLVLTAIDLPGMDGYALGRRLAMRWPALPIIYMSGTTHGLARRASLESPEKFIAKPFSAGDLLPKLDLALRLAAGACDDSRNETGSGGSTLSRETIAITTEAARRAVAYIGEEARWALLQKWLEEEPAGQRKAGRRSVKLEVLRSIVCPRINDREWDEVVRDHRPARWAAELRRANVLACMRCEPALLQNN
jgi:two-component system cell cycle response regulator CpdR